MKLLCIAALALIFTVSCQEPDLKSAPQQLFAPKGEDELKLDDAALREALTIIIKNDSEFIVTGKTGTAGPKKMNFLQVQEVLKNQATADINRIIVLRSTKKVSYRATVDVLDQMTINGFKRYTFLDLEEKELSKLETDYQLF